MTRNNSKNSPTFWPMVREHEYSSGKYLFTKVKSLKKYILVEENYLDFVYCYELKSVQDNVCKPSSGVTPPFEHAHTEGRALQR
jgi:hypothetical protein